MAIIWRHKRSKINGLAARLPLRILGPNYQGLAGMVTADITVVTIAQPDATEDSVSGYTLDEVTTGAFSGKGYYWLNIPASYIDTNGVASVQITCTDGTAEPIVFQVVYPSWIQKIS